MLKRKWLSSSLFCVVDPRRSSAVFDSLDGLEHVLTVTRYRPTVTRYRPTLNERPREVTQPWAKSDQPVAMTCNKTEGIKEGIHLSWCSQSIVTDCQITYNGNSLRWSPSSSIYDRTLANQRLRSCKNGPITMQIWNEWAMSSQCVCE